MRSKTRRRYTATKRTDTVLEYELDPIVEFLDNRKFATSKELFNLFERQLTIACASSQSLANWLGKDIRFQTQHSCGETYWLLKPDYEVLQYNWEGSHEKGRHNAR